MGKIEVEIPYTPRNWALSFHSALKRWMVLVLHRRAGKTTALVNHLQRAATNDEMESERIKRLALNLSVADLKELMRDRFYGLIFPTYTQAKKVAWDMTKYYSSRIPGTKANESELMVRYPNGSRLGLFGADNPDSFRGIGFWGLGFDEYQHHPPNIFSEVLST